MVDGHAWRTGRPSGEVDLEVVFDSELVQVRDNRCRRDDPRLSPPTPPLRFCEVTFPRSGVWVKHSGRQRLIIDANHVYFFNFGEAYRTSHPYGCGDRNTGIVLQPAVLLEIVCAADPGAADRPHAPFRRSGRLLDAPTCLLHHALLRVLRTEPCVDPLAVEELTLRLVARAVGSRERPRRRRRVRLATARVHAGLAEAVKALLAARFAERLTLARIARAVHASPYHLCRLFRERSGLSVHRYLERLRLHAALERLVDGDDGLQRIARDVGLADRSHLSRAFRRAFGTTPSALRSLRSARELRELAGKLGL